MSAARKTSKRALPNVPGAAVVQALGDAVFGKGNAVVEQTYPVTFAGRPVTVSLSVEEVTERFKSVTSLGKPMVPPRQRDTAQFLSECVYTMARVNGGHVLDVVDAILAARHGAAPPGGLDAITAAILALFRVAPDRGIAEDEVVRHLLASGLDVDSDDVGDRLVKMAMDHNAALDMVPSGKRARGAGPYYARGPAFPAATMGDRR